MPYTFQTCQACPCRMANQQSMQEFEDIKEAAKAAAMWLEVSAINDYYPLVQLVDLNQHQP